ncbi:MAG: MFS transporter, partial [Acidobacteriota bacterium]
MSESPSPKPTFRELLRALRSRRLLVLLFLGFSSGLPYMLMLSSLKIWLRREGIDLGTIGYFSWVAMIYNFNFLWAPLLDRFVPTRLGRRRSWMLFAQLGLIASIAALGISDPQVSIGFIAAVATLVSLFSATQDVAIDAYRRESLPDEEQGIAASLVVYGYRVAILVATGFGLWVVDPETWGLSFQQMFVMIAGLMLVGVVTTLACREPEMEHPL